MEQSVIDEFDNINPENVFDLEMDSWRSKMIKAYGDQHPYTFYVTAGHDFEDLILKTADINDLARETAKHQAFENLNKMSEVDQNAQKEFYALLSKMENEKATTELKVALEQKKHECAEVFQMFDKIVSTCEDYFKIEYSDCCKRMEKQVNYQEPVFSEVEKFLMEIEEFGNTELNSLRNRISQWVYKKGFTMLENIDKSYKWMNDQPFAMTLWSDCFTALTSNEIRNVFLADQRDTSTMWSKAFDDLLMLSAKLEKYRCNYNLMKFKLEREIFWMSREYKEKMPELNKIKRHLANFIDQKVSLKSEIKCLENEILKEQQNANDILNKMNKKIISTQANNKFSHDTTVRRFQNILTVKQEEIYNCLLDILKGDQFIHEKIIGVSWNSVDVSNLKPSDSRTDTFSTPLNPSSKIPDINSRDGFLDSFQILVSCNSFVMLLNMMADELGYMLDFTWANYAKEKLELCQEIKWIELFKVFKINFDEMRQLKKHMMSYCELNDNHEVIFHTDRAVDGFMHYVNQKRQMPSKNVLPSVEHDPLKYESYCSSVKDLIPKSLLWESVENLLFQYWKLLEMRSGLLKEKKNLINENSDFENYLINYYKYDTYHL